MRGKAKRENDLTNLSNNAIENAVEAHNASKLYRNRFAAQNINLIIPAGQVFGLLGPNGAGKTTFIKMLRGIITPTSGTVAVLGGSPGDKKNQRRIGYLPEAPAFHGFLTASDTLNLHGKRIGMRGDARKWRIPALLERVGLAANADTKISEFSRGMQQRLGLAQALLNDPPLVILDEPTAALDPFGRRDFREIIAEIRAQGTAVLLNSSILTDIETTCSHVAIFKGGTIAAQGSLDELIQTQMTVEIEVRELNDAALLAVRQIAAKIRLGRVPITKFTASLRHESDIPELARAIVENGSKLIALTPKRETLEELFLRIMEMEAE